MIMENTNNFNTILNSYLANDKDDRIEKTRLMLGSINLENEAIESLVSDFEYLADTWLNEFEKQIFSGITLQELRTRSK